MFIHILFILTMLVSFLTGPTEKQEVIFEGNHPWKSNSQIPDSLIPDHVKTKDLEIIDEAFLHGYTHNIVYENVKGEQIPTLSIQCTSEGIHSSEEGLRPDRPHFSVWTRDLYWGFLGWSQAGDDRVLEMMKSSIELLIEAKKRNKALGQSELWPLNDDRFYIPQAYTKGLKSALNLYPWCSESQVDFLLLCYNYWKMTGDIAYIKSIWDDILYVTETVEKLDTDGNSLPDALEGSYDYMWIKNDSEEPLMCAKTSMAYDAVASLASELGYESYTVKLRRLADKVRYTMNLPLEKGGLWKTGEDGGYYVQMRSIAGDEDSIVDMFIPYNNLVPMWCGMTTDWQYEKIFRKLDKSFDDIYDLKYGPMYCAPAGKNEQSVMDCSSVTWLAFLDVYLRGEKGQLKNRTRIWNMIIEHARDAGGIVFPEGAGVYGYLTGGAGRSWDNGNFFHTLIEGVYGIHKNKDGVFISDPCPLESEPFSELNNVHWRNAVYNFSWTGKGHEIISVSVGGNEIFPVDGRFILRDKEGIHKVEIKTQSSVGDRQDSVFAVFIGEETEEVHDSQIHNVNGVVFRDKVIWEPDEIEEFQSQWVHPDLEYDTEYKNLQQGHIDDLNIKAKNLYLSGCLNSIDMVNPAWGGGDGYKNLFLGDTSGIMRIGYRSGKVDQIPLIFGYTAWWHAPYQGHPEPFHSDPEYRELLDNSLCVINGLEGYRKESGEYFLKIELRDEIIDWIRFEDNPLKIGFYRVNGLSFGNPSSGTSEHGKYLMRRPAYYAGDREAEKMNKHIIVSENPFPQKRQAALSTLKSRLYTTVDDIKVDKIRSIPPEIHAGNFEGPTVEFEGSAIATLLTNIYYENSAVVMESIDEDGMIHESPFRADNYQSFGSWNEGLGAFYDKAYTRNRSMIVLSNYGMEEEVNNGVDFFDRWMMYYPNSYPDLQLGGKPVPGHASVMANHPHIYFDFLRHHGWPTRYETRDFGNPENDGHGFLMLSRYRAWVKQGRSREWLLQRWEAIEEAAEYILWCFENPDLSFSENGLLYNESEGGMQKQSMYCDYLCYLGLKAYAEMAETAGRPEYSTRWKKEATRLRKTMEAYYPKDTIPWGKVWDPEKNAGFVYTNSTLAPACIGMDYHGYDVMNDLPGDWARITRNTYKMQLTECKPEYAAPAGLGYGQCYLAQTALILDEMDDAEKLVEWMARFSFAPGLDHPYRVPEGATVSADGKTWRRFGDLGNLYQTVDVVHTLHLMIGIDDIDPGELLIMPRYIEQIDQASVKSWPVSTRFEGKSISNHLSYSLNIDRKNHKFSFTLVSDEPVDNVRVRLGPFPSDSNTLRVLKNGDEINTELTKSGDSGWVWFSLAHETESSLEVQY